MKTMYTACIGCGHEKDERKQSCNDCWARMSLDQKTRFNTAITRGAPPRLAWEVIRDENI